MPTDIRGEEGWTMMTGVRSSWTREQVEASLSEANETLAEAETTNRSSDLHRAGGVTIEADGASSASDATMSSSGDVLTVPADPPQQLSREEAI